MSWVIERRQGFKVPDSVCPGAAGRDKLTFNKPSGLRVHVLQLALLCALEAWRGSAGGSGTGTLSQAQARGCLKTSFLSDID